MMTLTGRRPVKVIMRLQLANQAFGLMASLVSHGPSGHALSLVLRTRRIRPLRGLINKNIAVRRTALKSTWPEGPCAILSIAWPFGPCSEPGPSGQANSAPSGPHNPKNRGPSDRSTQKSGPSGLDFWVRLAEGQAQNKSQNKIRGVVA